MHLCHDSTRPGRRLRRITDAAILLVLPAILTHDIAQARTWNVPSEAPTIQAGVDSAHAGDDVLVASGTYTWTSEGSVAGGAVVRMKAGVWLHSQAGASLAILDAEYQGRVIVCADVGTQTRIEGLTIMHGRILTIAPEAGGAGIQVTGVSEPTIIGCIIRENRNETFNSSGGGIYCDVATIEDCQILDNRVTTEGSGGGIRCGAARIQNCIFRGNVVSGDQIATGGAIVATSAVITNCTFEQNGASAFLFAYGGAVYGGASISSCTFIDNIVGAVINVSYGGAVVSGTGTVSDCRFINCKANSFGLANIARGGAIYSFGGTTIRNCEFIACSAQVVNTAGPGLGGALFAANGGLVESCTFLGNSGGSPGGVGGIVMNGGGTIRSIILASTTGQACSGTATWSCSDLFGNSEGDVICGTDGGGNFSADPQFCAQDPISSRNVTLQADSPCAPGNHPNGIMCGLIGAEPVDCGTVDVQERSWSQRSWSAVKALYR